MGLQIDSLELIGYDPETDTFPSTVFSNLSPAALPYRWDVQGDSVTITVSYGPLNATFTGLWREGGTFFSGGWRPDHGADETVNVPYDLGGHRLTYASREAVRPRVECSPSWHVEQPGLRRLGLLFSATYGAASATRSVTLGWVSVLSLERLCVSDLCQIRLTIVGASRPMR